MTIPVIAKLVKAFVGDTGLMDASNVDNDSTNQTGVLVGAGNQQAVNNRFDGTGVGSSIFRFTGSYAAQGTNIAEWFGGRQQTRLRCTSNGGLTPVIFTLPGSTALGTAFDQLVTAGLDETIRFVIEYTGPSTSFLNIVARAGGPTITGTTLITVRSGIAATVEVTRTGGVISSYVFASIGGITGGDGGVIDSIKLINPATGTWDASASGALPSTGVVKGNAYNVVNAPSDGTGRFGEVMQTDDWVVWDGDTFTSWAATPHQWFVLPAHEVRRISALESNFLSRTQEAPASERNAVIRGADYADSAEEIRLKIYATRAGYTAADLNTTGDIDVFTDPADQSGFLAIRLSGTQATLAAVLPTLYAYTEDASGNFIAIGNLATDFTYEGDFGQESDYLLVSPINYTANDNIRVYVTSLITRYLNPSLDVTESNLSDRLQSIINQREASANTAAVFFSNAGIRDIHAADRIEYTTGYSLGVDWRDMVNSTTINDNRYLDSGLSITSNNASFEVSGFGVGLQKIIAIELQRNDGQSGDGALIEIAPGVAFVRVNTSNKVQINTTPGSGSETWVTLDDGSGNINVGSGTNFLLFEVVPTSPDGDQATGGQELIADFYDGTNYHEANTIRFTASGNVHGDHLGFSRSAAQRGQILRFSAIKSPGYLTHNQIETLARQHRDDKWNFGFARLYVGATERDVIIRTGIILEGNTNGTLVRLVVDDSDLGDIKLGLEAV